MSFEKKSSEAQIDRDIERYKSEAEQLRDANPEELTEEREFLKRFSVEDKKKIFKTFRAIDADQNWALSVEELQAFMFECNLDSSFTNLIMRIIHPDKQEGAKEDNGQITFEEFLHFISLLQDVQKNANYLFETLFNVIDKDGNHLLEKNEVVEFINCISDDQDRIQEDEVQNFLKKLGKESFSFEDLKAILE